jgi:hypothetical protein
MKNDREIREILQSNIKMWQAMSVDSRNSIQAKRLAAKGKLLAEKMLNESFPQTRT